MLFRSVKACPFDAIHVIDGVAVVDKEACKACGKCIAACPKRLIELVPYDQKHLVQCSSKDKGKDVMKACSVGCIGCKMCEKVCQFDAVKVDVYKRQVYSFIRATASSPLFLATVKLMSFLPS